MNRTRRDVIISLVCIPVVSACSSGGGDAPPAAPSESSPEPVACDEITPFTPLSDVEACGSLIDPDSGRAALLQYEVTSTQPGQACATCVFYRGAEGSVTGVCSLLSGGLVSAGGWCTSYRES